MFVFLFVCFSTICKHLNSPETFTLLLYYVVSIHFGVKKNQLEYLCDDRAVGLLFTSCKVFNDSFVWNVFLNGAVFKNVIVWENSGIPFYVASISKNKF